MKTTGRQVSAKVGILCCRPQMLPDNILGLLCLVEGGVLLIYTKRFLPDNYKEEVRSETEVGRRDSPRYILFS